MALGSDPWQSPSSLMPEAAVPLPNSNVETPWPATGGEGGAVGSGGGDDGVAEDSAFALMESAPPFCLQHGFLCFCKGSRKGWEGRAGNESEKI